VGVQKQWKFAADFFAPAGKLPQSAPSERLVRVAPCPVLTVRHPEAAKKHRAELVYDMDHILP
jgi:hypothetical protein